MKETIRQGIVGWSRGRVVPVHVTTSVVRNNWTNGSMVFMAAGSGLKDATHRIETAVGDPWARMMLDHHPLQNQDVVYSLDPVTTEYHPTLDMALCAGILDAHTPDEALYCGEVGQAGAFRKLTFPLEAGRIARQMKKVLVCPAASAPLAARTGAAVVGVESTSDMVRKFEKGLTKAKQTLPAPLSRASEPFPEFDDLKYIRGQRDAKWALEVAVAGGHNLLLVGSPGEGKSALAMRAYTIAPPLLEEESVEVSSIWQGAGRLDPTELMTHRPCIEAGRQTTPVALLGGGDAYSGARPGLVSLAHKGILLADEFFEWPRTAAESLRGPLQDRRVTLARRDWQITFPADFQFVATANPCPCGNYGSPYADCRCTEAARRRYLAKISGPVFDRIDIRVRVEALGRGVLTAPLGESSAEVGARVRRAMEIQAARYAGAGITRNAELGPGMLDAFCNETPVARETLMSTAGRQQLSARGVSKLRALARTVADLEDSETVRGVHVVGAAKLMLWQPQVGDVT